MATNQFFPMNALKSAVIASKNDLAKVRALNAALSQKVMAVSNKSQFTADHIREQTALFRAEASRAAQDHLTKERTFERLQSIAAQGQHWTVRSFLARQPSVQDPQLEKYDESGNTIKLMKAQWQAMKLNNILLSVNMMDTATLEATADSAVVVKDWTTVGAVANALGYRAEKGDDVARRARNRIDQTEIPEAKEANDLITEARYFERLINNTMESLVTGGDDIGLRVEQYAEIEQARNQPAAA